VRPHHGLRERALLGALALLLGTLAACKSDHVPNRYPTHNPSPAIVMPDRGIGLLAESFIANPCPVENESGARGAA
jgi:hypothetical protein